MDATVLRTPRAEVADSPGMAAISKDRDDRAAHDDQADIDSGPPTLTRAQFAEALIMGEPVSSSVACLYPDIVQIADPLQLRHPWMLRAIRTETGPGCPHYVLVGPDQGALDYEVFHVQMIGSQRALVSRVSIYQPIGAMEKFYHDPVSVTPEDKELAVAAWQRVDRFVSSPMDNASLVLIAQPNHEQQEPRRKKRPRA